MTALPPSPPPGNNKAIAAVISGALSTIVIYILNQFIHPPLPAEIAGAISTVLTTAAVWLVPHGDAS